MDEELISPKKCPAVRYVLAEPTLFVTDAELIRRVPEKAAYAALHVLDREKHRGFPQKQKYGATADTGRR